MYSPVNQPDNLQQLSAAKLNRPSELPGLSVTQLAHTTCNETHLSISGSLMSAFTVAQNPTESLFFLHDLKTVDLMIFFQILIYIFEESQQHFLRCILLLISQ